MTKRLNLDPRIGDAILNLIEKQTGQRCHILHMSDIGADGLPLVRLGDPSTTPAREWIGIAATLPMAFTAAALRARASLDPSHGR